MTTKRRAGFFSRFDASQFRITRGAMILLFIEVGLSLVYLLSEDSARATMVHYMAPSADSVFRHYRVWTVLTGPFLEDGFGSLLVQSLMLWFFVPTLERWWGTKRFLTFFAVTSVVGTIAGSAMGLLTARAGLAPVIVGYDPFIYASIVAYGILYGKQPVSFFGVLPMTARQLMYGMLAVATLFVLLGRQWEVAAAWGGAIAVGGVMSSGRWNPRLWWYRWRHRRVRRKLEVLDGGRARPKPPREEMLN